MQTQLQHPYPEIERIVSSIKPFDTVETEQIAFIQKWIASGAEIFRIAKPATPDTHLVSYFLLIDENVNRILLVDHKKACLWLPPGGHVEPNEHPRETVKREILEELGITANFLLHDPLFATVTKTVGQTAGHTDVSLWYLLKGDSTLTLDYDRDEFNDIQWFNIECIPYENSDPHMRRFIQKLLQARILQSNFSSALSFRIQFFEAQHQSEVVDLIEHIQVGEFNIPIEEGQRKELQSISSSFQKDKGNYWVALFNGKVIGTIAVIDIGHKSFELRDVFLDKEYRGSQKGFAKKLLDTVLAWSKKHNVDTIYLGTTLAFRAAHRFYEKHGFREIARKDMPSYCQPMDCDEKFYQLDL